jgi:uncharacterized protein (DUF983 family)
MTITIACPWCDAPLGAEDAFVTPSVRCDVCATSVDFEPVAVAPALTIRAAA